MKRKLNHNVKLSFDVSALPAFTKEQVLPLITRLVADGRTASYPGIDFVPGIQYKQNLNYFDDAVIFQEGAGCGGDPTGNTVFTKKEIEVSPILVLKSWCPDELRTKWTQMLLQPGSTYDQLPEQAAITELLMALMADNLEQADWKGDSASGNVNLNKYDGIIKQIAASGDAIAANVTGGGYTAQSSITDANVISITDQMVKSLPASMKGGKSGAVMFVGWDTFESLLRAYFNLNHNFVDNSGATPYETGDWILPKWGIKISAFHGLTGTNRLFLTVPDNIVIGSDLAGEYEDWDVWYEKLPELLYARVRFKRGVQIKKGYELVQYTNV